jgi:hypothetical protein
MPAAPQEVGGTYGTQGGAATPMSFGNVPQWMMAIPGFQDFYTNLLSGPNAAYGGAVIEGLTMNAPSIFGLEQGQQQNVFGGAITQSELAQQSGYEKLLAGLQQQGIGLSLKDLAIQRGALGRQTPLLNQEHALQMQLLGIEESGAKRDEAFQQQQYTGERAAAGASWAPGTGRGIHEMQAQLADRLKEYGIQGQQETLDYKEQLARLQDQQKSLNIQAQRLGLSSEQLSAQLNNTLAQLGLQGVLTAAQVAQGATDEKGQLAGLFQQILQTAMTQAVPGTG